MKKHLKSELSFPRFLSVPKYSQLLELDLSDLKYQFIDQTIASRFLKYLQNNTNLKIVKFNNNNLAKLPAFPFSSSLIHCQALSLSSTNLETEQINSILGKCCGGRYVEKVDFSFNDFTFVNLSILSGSILTLKDLNLSYTNLTAAYTKKLMMSVQDSTIRCLDLSGNDLYDCTFDNISLNQDLEILKLSHVKLNPENLNRIFSNLTLVHHLEQLFLDGSAHYLDDFMREKPKGQGFQSGRIAHPVDRGGQKREDSYSYE